MDRNETWEAMSNLEDAFNRIITIETLVNDLESATNAEDLEEIRVLTKALVNYLPTYISNYDKASKRAWNKTVRKIQEERNNNLNYEEIKYGLTLEEESGICGG